MGNNCFKHLWQVDLKILRLLADGVTDAVTLSLTVTTRIKRKDDIRKSLTNCFTKEHCLLISELMGQYNHIQLKLLRVSCRLEKHELIVTNTTMVSIEGVALS